MNRATKVCLGPKGLDPYRGPAGFCEAKEGTFIGKYPSGVRDTARVGLNPLAPASGGHHSGQDANKF